MTEESQKVVTLHVNNVEDERRSVRRMTVDCPHQGKEVPLDECSVCNRYRGITFDSSSTDWVLRCTPEDAALIPDALAKVEHETLPPLMEEQADGGGTFRAAMRTPVAAVMNQDVVSVRETLLIDELLVLLREMGISGAPVVDDEGKVIGVVSKTDVLGLFETVSEDKRRALVVRDLMTPIAFTVAEDTPIVLASALMAYEGVHRLPVVTSEGEVIGILSTLDVLHWLADKSGYVMPARRRTRASGST